MKNTYTPSHLYYFLYVKFSVWFGGGLGRGVTLLPLTLVYTNLYQETHQKTKP